MSSRLSGLRDGDSAFANRSFKFPNVVVDGLLDALSSYSLESILLVSMPILTISQIFRGVFLQFLSFGGDPG